MTNLMNVFAIDGGEVKATDVEGQVNGMAIVFGNKDQPDQSSMRDFFTKDSNIRKTKSFSVPLYHEHGAGLTDEEIGEAVLTKSEKGWTAMAQIDTSTEVGKTVYEQVKTKPHGFSTGAMNHLVKRVQQSNGTNFLKKWGVGELSLTETPAEKRAAVYSVKSKTAEGAIETEAVKWTDEEITRLEQTNWTLALYKEDGTKYWDIEDGTPFPKEVEGKTTLELKSETYGDVRYSVSNYGDGDGGFTLDAYVWGGADDLIDKIQGLLNKAKNGVKSEQFAGEKDFESRVASVVKSLIEKKADDKDISELKNQLKTKDDELTEVKAQLEAAEKSLTDAQADIENLKVLAGAKETIDKNKGK